MQTWMFYGLLSALSAALVAVFGKVGISHVDTTMATTIRSVVMAVFLVIMSVVLGKTQFIDSLDSRAMLFIVLAGLAGAASWLFYFLALKNGPATGVVAMDRLSVIFVLILAVMFLGEKLTWSSGLGAVLIMAGAILLSIR